MRIALVSTYPPAECGIGNYTRELRRALHDAAPDVAVQVLAERTPVSPADRDVTQCWDRRGDWVGDIASAIERDRPDVVHVQHEEAHYGQDARFTRLIERARAAGARTVVTLHSVYDRRLEIPGRISGAGFHRRLARVCDAMIAHQRHGMASVLAAHGVRTEQIHVIPHGTPTMDLPDRITARRALDLPEHAPMALFFGFIHPKKNVHTAVRAFLRVAVDIPSACLVIAGRPRDRNASDRGYLQRLQRLMRASIDSGRIFYRPGYIPVEHKPLYYAATDVLLLPHHQDFGSASGVLHEGLAARRAILCSRGKKFDELVCELGDMRFATPHALDVDAWEVGMERLLGNILDQRRVSRVVERLADVTSWQASAMKHADLYRAVCRGITNMSQVG